MPAFKNKYSYRKGYNFKVPAQVVGETLDKIAKKGAITSQALLDVSRPEESPTHKLFEWNDTIAAERYRLQQATIAINSIEVQIIDKSTSTSTSCVAFVNVTSKAPRRAGSFVPINIALSDGEMRDTVLLNAMNELKSFRRKYSQLSELFGVFAAIDEMEQDEQNVS